MGGGGLVNCFDKLTKNPNLKRKKRGAGGGMLGRKVSDFFLQIDKESKSDKKIKNTKIGGRGVGGGRVWGGGDHVVM